jgi:hypothetical protein
MPSGRAGHDCSVVAPSLTARSPGERIETDRQDAINFAKLHPAGGPRTPSLPHHRNHVGRRLYRNPAHESRRESLMNGHAPSVNGRNDRSAGIVSVMNW